MDKLSNLPNIGKNTEKQLNDIGIFSADQLINTGSKQAWLKIKEMDSSACIHRLYGLEGAIRGIRKAELPDDVKKD
ncbi:MAG: TfoX/Sxy family protein, partial [Eubacteriaceae bacterium]|nr:TfoX/Sxy family protein [Eubacteriaceae bacterium]